MPLLLLGRPTATSTKSGYPGLHWIATKPAGIRPTSPPAQFDAVVVVPAVVVVGVLK